jgi:hypothetical protein
MLMPLATYFKALSGFNWSFNRSLDPNVYQAGSREYKELLHHCHNSKVHFQMLTDWQAYRLSITKLDKIKHLPKPKLGDYECQALE